MQRRIRLGLLYGGRSAEHEISILSAVNVYAAADPVQFDVTLLWIDPHGAWHLVDSPRHLRGESVPTTPVAIAPCQDSGFLALGPTGMHTIPLDVVFPVLHGTNGEDGAIQGLLEAVGIAYVGSGVLSSAVCMDKDIAKRLLRAAGLPIADFRLIRRGDSVGFDDLSARFGTPFFLKPSNAGSSIGINKIRSTEEYDRGLKEALRFDNKVLAEQCINGREIECSVMDGRPPVVSVPGEIKTTYDFYSYQAKYEDEKATSLVIPASLSPEVTARVRQLAAEAYTVLECEGMARADFFLDKDDSVYINELNTIPGFTSHSMFPMLWEPTGVSFTELVTKLVKAALSRFHTRNRLRYSR